MTEIFAARIICEARTRTFSVNLSKAEIYYVASSQLKGEEKFLWLLLATLTYDNAFLSLTFSYQTLSELMGLKAIKIHQALLSLKAMGFIQISGLPVLTEDVLTPEMISQMRYLRLLLPSDGLLKLKKAPQCEHSLVPWHENGKYRRPQILIDLLNLKEKNHEGINSG